MLKIKSIFVARFLTIVVFVLAFFLYSGAIHKGFFPGESVRISAISMGLERNLTRERLTLVEVFNPQGRDVDGNVDKDGNVKKVSTSDVNLKTKNLLWYLISRGFLKLKLGSISDSLGILCAILGAISIAFFFSLSRMLLLFFSFNTTLLSAKIRKRAALFSATLGSIALAFSMAVFVASTRALPNMLEVVIYLSMGHLLLRTIIRHTEMPLLFFGVLCGVSIFETTTGIVVFPLWIFLVIRAMLLGDVQRSRGWSYAVSGFIFSSVLYLALSQLCFGREGVGMRIPIAELIDTATGAISALRSGAIFESSYQLSSCIVGVIPFIAALAMAIWRSNDLANASSGILFFAMACTSTIALLGRQVIGLGLSPWDTSLSLSNTPTLVYTLVAFVVAYISGQGMLLAGGKLLPRSIAPESKQRQRKKHLDDDEVVEEQGESPLGRLLALYVLALVIFASFVNVVEIKNWQEPLTNMVVSKIISSSGPASWYASNDGRINSHIRVLASLAKKRIIPIDASDPERTATIFERAVKSDKSFENVDTSSFISTLNSTNMVPFLENWIANDEKITDKVLFEENTLTSASGFVPHFFAFKVAPKEGPIDWKRIAEEHLAFWDEIAALPVLPSSASNMLRTYREEIREHLFVVGSALADSLAENGEEELSAKVREKANAIRKEEKEKSLSSSNEDLIDFYYNN